MLRVVAIDIDDRARVAEAIAVSARIVGVFLLVGLALGLSAAPFVRAAAGTGGGPVADFRHSTVLGLTRALAAGLSLSGIVVAVVGGAYAAQALAPRRAEAAAVGAVAATVGQIALVLGLGAALGWALGGGDAFSWARFVGALWTALPAAGVGGGTAALLAGAGASSPRAGRARSASAAAHRE